MAKRMNPGSDPGFKRQKQNPPAYGQGQGQGQGQGYAQFDASYDGSYYQQPADGYEQQPMGGYQVLENKTSVTI
jgi:hypothetical protein